MFRGFLPNKYVFSHENLRMSAAMATAQGFAVFWFGIVQESHLFPAPATEILRHMAQIFFTQQLKRFTEVPELTVSGDTLRAALDAAFMSNPRIRGYVLDDQGHLRANVVAFIDGQRVRDRISLCDPVLPTSQVYVMQALSGG